MSDHCESKRILVDIQDNGIIRRADTGYLIGNLSRDYPFSDLCIGTGEVVGNSEQLKSRSVQRREALQKGEPMPKFDKPEMPERRIEMDIKIAREIAARIWCDQEMRSVEMDSTLCERIAQLLAGSDLAVEREKVREEGNG